MRPSDSSLPPPAAAHAPPLDRPAATAPGRAAAPAAPATDSADGIPVPRRGRLGPLSLAQILVAEAAVLTVVAAATRGLLQTLTAGLLAALVLTALFARRQGRWWLEHQQIARDHHRRRAARPDPEAGPLLAVLRTIAPGLSVRDLTTPGANGSVVGVARDEAGWFSVLTLAPGTPPIPLDLLTGLIAGAGQPGVVLQLVTHTIPAPSLDVHPGSPAATSYRQLMDAPVPAHRESSICVRVDARTLAEALLDPDADPEAAAARTAGLARRIVAGLRRQGITGQVLDADGLLATLARHCDLEPGSAVDETWTHWRSTRLIHRTYWLRTWPAHATEFLAWAAAAPVAQATVTLLLTADEQGVAVRALLHLATRPEADLTALHQMLLDGARRSGAELQPLDGEQGPAVYATAPTGGGAG